MKLPSGFIIALVAGLVLLIAFFAPWTNLNFGILNFGSGNGLDLAKDRPALYVIPVIGVICTGIGWAGSRDLFPKKTVSVLLILMGLSVLIYLLLAMTYWFNAEFFGISVNFGKAGWGLWLTLLSSAAIALSGLMGILENG